MEHSGNKKARVYKVPADKWELPGIPEVVLDSFKPHWAVRGHEEQRGRGGSPNCPSGHVRKGKGACVECSAGKFSLSGWIACRRLLACDDFKLNVRVEQRLYVDAVVGPNGYLHDWTLHRAEWEGLKTIMVCPNISATINRLRPDLLYLFHTSQSPLHAIGLCPDDSCVLYSASRTYKWLPLLSILRDSHAVQTLRPAWQLWYTRLAVVHNVIQVLAQLHSTGKYTLCSGTSVEGILQQFLVNSESGQVSLVGFGNVVSTTESSKASYSGTCSKWREQSAQGLFAPEEVHEAIRGGRYGHHRTFIDRYPYLASRPAADLWKVPDLAGFIMGGIPGGDLVLNYLSALHLQCKSVDPDERPSFPQVLSTYWETLQLLRSIKTVNSMFHSHS